MKVTRVLSMAEYDDYCRKSLPNKIPEWGSSDFRRKVGDDIYDYSHPHLPELRPSVHTEENRKTDLRGENVLLSNHFYYFGNKPVELPKRLLPIVHDTQGHKSHANTRYAADFVAWLETAGYRRNTLHGEPQLKEMILSTSGDELRSVCSRQHREQDEQDEVC